MTIVLASLCLFLSLILIIWVWARSPFHVAAFFAVFAIADVFFPAIYWAAFGQVTNPDWLPTLSEEKILLALAFYSAFFFVFIFCVIGSSSGVRKPDKIYLTLTNGFESRLVGSLWFFLILTLVKMGSEVVSYGGLESWLWSRVVFQTNTDGISVEQVSLFSSLPLREAFQALVGVGFYCRKRVNQTRLISYFFPTVALFLAMATFLRGTVLTYFITLLFAEFMRVRSERMLFPVVGRRKSGPIVMAALAGFFSIYLYGAVRDGFRGAVDDKLDTEINIALPTFITGGHGLLGASHIVAEYGQSVSFLGGKTYLDMLLLPVPRSIYPSKPAWYGIDDITRGMGWPESTQSAVTMPGEAFANFGFWGLLLAIPMGILFGLLQKFIQVDRVRHLLLGPSVFFQMVSVANWMSFTGVMNSMTTLVFFLAVAAYLTNIKLYRA